MAKKFCESCLVAGEHVPATMKSYNPEFSGLDLCQKCADEYNRRWWETYPHLLPAYTQFIPVPAHDGDVDYRLIWLNPALRMQHCQWVLVDTIGDVIASDGESYRDACDHPGARVGDLDAAEDIDALIAEIVAQPGTEFVARTELTPETLAILRNAGWPVDAPAAQ